MHQLETGKFMFKAENLLLPITIGNYFDIDRCAEEHSHYTRTRSVGSNSAPRLMCRTKTGEKSIQFVGSNLWHELTSELRSCESFSSFKCQYKRHLLEI